jgi:tetratricopeptide (TPR) repeat protein
MSKTWLISAMLLVSGLRSIAAGDNLQWQKANTFYQQKQYDSAAWYYEQIAAAKPHNADLYYNLGNTYYRLNKIGPSVLNYERALKIDPERTDARENLLLAQSRIANSIHPIGDIFFVRWWKMVTRSTHATPLAITALVLFLLFIGLLIARRLGVPGLPVQVQAILLCAFSCVLILAVCAARNAADHSAAVVMEADAPMMNSELKGKPLALIPEGTVITIIASRAEWIQVRLPDGREGWLKQDAATRI